jgi:hypothetical protein
MFLTDLIGWWYGAGFKDLFLKFNSFFAATSDFFSINDLAKSLFKPYRQTLTSVNYKRTLGQKLGDAFVSRTIGFLVRFFLILFGLVTLAFQGLVMVLCLLMWPFVPLMPFLLILLSLIGFGF